MGDINWMKAATKPSVGQNVMGKRASFTHGRPELEFHPRKDFEMLLFIFSINNTVSALHHCCYHVTGKPCN